MKLYDINGNLQSKNVGKFKIKWNKKSRSKIQFTVKQFLKPFWKNQRVFEEFPVYGTLMKVDILNATNLIAIEVQGKQHNEFNEFFHGGSRMNFLRSIKRDQEKNEWLSLNGFKLIEINEDEIKELSKEFFFKKFNLKL